MMFLSPPASVSKAPSFKPNVSTRTSTNYQPNQRVPQVSILRSGIGETYQLPSDPPPPESPPPNPPNPPPESPPPPPPLPNPPPPMNPPPPPRKPLERIE